MEMMSARILIHIIVQWLRTIGEILQDDGFVGLFRNENIIGFQAY